MASDESEKEAKVVKTLLATSIIIDHEEDDMAYGSLSESLAGYHDSLTIINEQKPRGH